VNEEITKINEPPLPGSLSTSEDWERYYEYRAQLNRLRSDLGPLTLERFKDLVDDPCFEFPMLSEAKIGDMSKGDGLSKFIAILQTSWFIFACIMRGIRGLALTEIELVTLAVASLNAITFAFWWSKPLDVKEPVSILVPAGAEENVARQGRGDRNSVENVDIDIVTASYTISEISTDIRGAVEFVLDPFRYMHYPGSKTKLTFAPALRLYLARLPYRLFFILTWPVFMLFPLGIQFLMQAIKTKRVKSTQDADTVASRVVHSLQRSQYNLTHTIRNYLGRRDGPLWIVIEKEAYKHPSFVKNWFFIIPASFFLLVLVLIVLSPVFALFFITSFTFTAVFEIVTTTTVPPDATHVPSFYAPRTKSDRYSRMVVFAFFGVIFGGIHCMGWNFIFPTHSEKFLWRCTSSVLTIIPSLAAPIDYALENYDLDKRFGKVIRISLDIFMTILLFVYVGARLSLIAQALALLRQQPATAFIAVEWTKNMPHLF